MEKDITISKIRFIATSMVVILHILQHLERLYYNLHYFTDWFNLGLVMFFAISGFLYSNRTIKNQMWGGWLAHRYKELAIPSVLVTLLTLIVYNTFIGNLPRETVFYSLLSGLGLEAFVPDGWMFIQLWFLTYILVCYITIPIIQIINVTRMSEFTFWSMIIVTTLVLQGLGTGVSLMWELPVLSWGVLFRFYLSYMLFKRYSIKSDKCRKCMVILSVFSIVLIGVVVYVRYIWSPQGLLGSVAELLFIYTQTLAGVVLFYWLYQLFSKIDMNEKMLKLSDKYSYTVYLTHCLFIGYSTSVIDRCPNYFIGILVALVCTAVASVLAEKVSGAIKKEIRFI